MPHQRSPLLGGLASSCQHCKIAGLWKSGVWLWVDVASPQTCVLCRSQTSGCTSDDMDGMKRQSNIRARTQAHMSLSLPIWLMYNDTPQHHIHLQAAPLIGANSAHPSTPPFAPWGLIPHSPSQFPLSVLTPFPSSLYHSPFSPLLLNLIFPSSPYHLTFFPLLPGCTCLTIDSLSLPFVCFFKIL